MGVGEAPKLESSPKKFWRPYGDVKGILNYYYLNPGETTAAAYCQEIKIRPEKSDLKMILWLINMNPHFYVTALDLMCQKLLKQS